MKTKVLLVTPPFTQLNTPYPAAPYLKGFLKSKGYSSFQTDLSIETFLALFTFQGLEHLFEYVEKNPMPKSKNAKRMIGLKTDYGHTIEKVISFLQGKNPTLAYSICLQDFLPQASRFESIEEPEETFGFMGIQDRAKYLCTLYMEDLFDLITECIDPNFGLNRYAEHLGRSAAYFDDLYSALQNEPSVIESFFIEILHSKFQAQQPELIALTVPFPGNLFSALRCAQWTKQHFPHIKIAMGGGYVNTELRSVSEIRLFEFIDFLLFDDGEAPLECLLEHLEGKRDLGKLKRCFICKEKQVIYINDSEKEDYPFPETSVPDYSDLDLDSYISFIEVANPMHSLWSNGRWNKLTMAHGCYWAQCSFCDTSLPYIKQYEALTAQELCNRIEMLVKQTGQSGFHFVDEAAPPALMRELALEILHRNLCITWWTNIRFEKSFSADLCLLLKASGCIAISGGLEVASNHLLKQINKGVSVEQVAQVADHFTQAGIMVHAYLMYGFPGQTVQETIDSLEMVRQLFQEGILYSAFWHKFTMTVHSPIGQCPEKYGAKVLSNSTGSFANNDLEHADHTGIQHSDFAEGLRTALFNYMHGVGFDIPLQQWFHFKTPCPQVPLHFIIEAIEVNPNSGFNPHAKWVWIGNKPYVHFYSKTKKGKTVEVCSLLFHSKTAELKIELSNKQGEWLLNLLDKTTKNNTYSLQEIKTEYESRLNEPFELFFYSKTIEQLRENGLLIL